MGEGEKRCGERCREVWDVGGGVRKCWGTCGKVCWGVGEVRGEVSGKVRGDVGREEV